MNWLQSIIYSFISGFSEFVPVSAQAHEAILKCLFGAENQPLLQCVIRLGGLMGVLFSCRSQLARLKRERRLARIPKNRRKRQPEIKYLYELRLLRGASVLIVLGAVCYFVVSGAKVNLSWISFLLLVNGFAIFLPQLHPSGNKDGRAASPADSFLVGLVGCLGYIPGLSRVGTMISAMKLRGCERQYALHMSLLVSIPAILAVLAFEVFQLISAGFSGVTFGFAVQCLICGMVSFAGSVCAITFMRFLSVKTGFAAFAYYSWGAALFSFILFLTT